MDAGYDAPDAIARATGQVRAIAFAEGADWEAWLASRAFDNARSKLHASVLYPDDGTIRDVSDGGAINAASGRAGADRRHHPTVHRVT